MSVTIDAVPFRFPISAALDPKRTAMLAIDMQVDFCGPDGMVHRWGVDLSAMRAPIEPLRRVMEACRKAAIQVIHTRETYAPDLSDFPAARRARQSAATPVKATGDRGPHGRHARLLAVRGRRRARSGGNAVRGRDLRLGRRPGPPARCR